LSWGLAGLSALAWAYIIALAWRMPRIQPWGATEVLLTWVMGAVIMVAMMTASAAPMILTDATMNH
jgi:predicted metal-binding membrane protein